MPIIYPSTYSPPPFFSNGHLQTVFPSLFRKVRGIQYLRERIVTPDDDFLDLDWSRVNSRKLCVLCHGLEGNSTRTYILGMVRALNRRGWDALAWNFRGCSGEPNRCLRFYHSGETQDLDCVIRHAMAKNSYSSIALVGFSLGGNVILKYLGERAENLTPVVKKAVTFSVPCDLGAGARAMAHPSNRIYMKRFLNMLHEKVRIKKELFPGQIDDSEFDEIKTFGEFDGLYTAPIHGFKDAEDYWEKSACKPYLTKVRIPTLLVSALDDPLLAASCYPVEEARKSSHFFLEIPASGGHVGFVSFGNEGEYWSELRAIRFIDEH